MGNDLYLAVVLYFSLSFQKSKERKLSMGAGATCTSPPFPLNKSLQVLFYNTIIKI